MTLLGTDHLVIAVNDIDAGISNWRDKLGLKLSHRASVAGAGLEQAFFKLADNTFVELIAPADNESALAKTLEARGEGVHVLAMKVADLDEAIESLQRRGVRLIGVGSSQVFIHPKSANGVMIQLWPIDRPHRWQSLSSQSS